MPLKGTGGNIDSPVGRGKVLPSVSDGAKTAERNLKFYLKDDSVVTSRGYLWISGLFLAFIISTSAAFLWYMANRSLNVMSAEGKC